MHITLSFFKNFVYLIGGDYYRGNRPANQGQRGGRGQGQRGQGQRGQDQGNQSQNRNQTQHVDVPAVAGALADLGLGIASNNHNLYFYYFASI